MKQRIKYSPSKQTIARNTILSVLQLFQIALRHFIELQGELHLCNSDLKKILNRLLKKGYIEKIDVDITHLPEIGNQFVKAYLKKANFSFPTPTYVSKFDYPSGEVTFYHITSKGLRHLKKHTKRG